jgi:transcriptional regulator with XRE-family HTH domain
MVTYAQNRRQPSIEQLYKIAILLKLEAKDWLKNIILPTNMIEDKIKYSTALLQGTSCS